MSKTNAFDELGDILSNDFTDMMKKGCRLEILSLTDILVDAQIREQFEDEENTLSDMEASIKRHGVFQTVLVRPIPGPIPYKLVAGERRYLGSERAGELTIPAMIKELTDEEADDIQLAENIQRKNLTQIEQAKKVQKDLDTLGSVDAVLEKHSKGRKWLSQILSLLTLPEQAKRLITEQISADVDLINSVKVVEKNDPAAARALVDDLKETRGKGDARKKVAEVKAQVKPKATRPAKEGAATANDEQYTLPGTTVAGNFADAKIGAGQSEANQGEATAQRSPRLTAPEALHNAFMLIFESGSHPKMFLETLQPEEREDVQAWLESFFHAGRQCKNLSKAVIQGLRNGSFADDGAGAFAMMAFLQGADAEVKKFSVIDVLGLVRP
jgi:ParB/RepB/Spo0J family partition protein